MTRVSVVIPVYNVEAHLPSCLEGLLSQSFPRQDYEIIIVDNNSTDRSAAIARAHDGVRLLTEPRQGSYAARNTGVGQASGDIIAFIDPDCRPAPQWLESIAAAMQDRECGIVLGRRHYGAPATALALLADYEAEKIAYVVDRGTRELYYGYTNNMAVRRAVFDRIGPFPERTRGGDTMFVRRAVDQLGCGVVRFNPRMEVQHLEVDTVRDYYRKRAVYGRSNERIGQVIAYRPLSSGERWRVFARMVRTRQLPLPRAMLLFALLVPGALIYEWARRAARLVGAPAAIFRDRPVVD